jgi:hypothetical protein
MKVSLRYRRLPKPRGAWNFGLWAAFEVAYTPEERESLNPNWDAPLKSTILRCCCGNGSKYMRKDASSGHSHDTGHDPRVLGLDKVVTGVVCGYWKLNCSASTTWETTFWCSAPEFLEGIIADLHSLRAHALEQAEKFWRDNAPHDGRPEECYEEEFLGDNVSPIIRPARKLARVQKEAT